MKIYIIMGSPRKNGNTAALLEPFMQELTSSGIGCEMTWLYDKTINPCIACRSCQSFQSIFGCGHKDDVQEIFDKILDCDLLVLATPIYSWYCTPPLKSLLDRLVYGMNKYYNDEKGPSLWKDKLLALITTCGYQPEKGADLLDEGIKRYCKHSQMHYIGMLAERDLGYQSVFMDEEKSEHARLFAKKLLTMQTNQEKR